MFEVNTTATSKHTTKRAPTHRSHVGRSATSSSQLLLTLVYKLMQAVAATQLPIQVINATYPDMIHPVLKKVGLAPTTGIGDLANNISAIKIAIALKLQVKTAQEALNCELR